MNDFVASGRIVDAVLVVMAIEAVVLIVRRAISGRGIETQALLRALAPGIGLLLAVRAALTGESWGVVAACLSVAGILHVFDLAYRHRSLVRQHSIAAETADPSRA
jgi:hypothetical protein